MTDEEIYRALDLDDSFVVVRVLAKGPGGETQLVRRASGGDDAPGGDDASGVGETPGGGDAPGAGATAPIEAAAPPEVTAVEEDLLLVRKYIPLELANRRAWEVVRDICDPRLPRVRLTYELPDRLVVVYDYVRGESLAERVAGRGAGGAGGALGADEAVAVAIELCAALGLLHDRGIVHRDVSPGNVILADGCVRLIDLGIARSHAEGARHDTTRLGTWGFAAPEQYGFAQTDARSDVYSLGRLLGYMLTGVEPTDPDYETRLGEVDARVAGVVERACAFEPSARYQGVGEMAGALAGATTGATTGAGGAVGRLAARSGDVDVVRRLSGRASFFLACLRGTRGWRRAVAAALLVVGTVAGLLVAMAAVNLALHPTRETDAFSAALAVVVLVVVELGVVYHPVTCLLPDASVVASAGAPTPPERGLRAFLKREAQLLLAGLLALGLLTVLATLVIGSTPAP